MSAGGARPPAAPPAPRVGPADRIAVALGSLGFVGFVPVAPATVASAVATIGLAVVLPLAAARAAALVLAIFLVGAWACGRIERLYGHDPAAAVLDEVCGMALTLVWVPVTPAALVLGFVLFRVFDVLKLPPARAAERLPGGWGIMLDDVVAGAYAAAVLRASHWLWPDLHLGLWHWALAGVGGIAVVVFRKPLLRKYGKPRTRLAARRGSERP